MNRKSSLKIWFSILAVIALLTLFVGCTANPNDQAINLNGYYTEQNVPGVIRVIAVTENSGLPSGYGEALARAVENISQQYTIVEITPITYGLGTSSATKELIIIVKPK